VPAEINVSVDLAAFRTEYVVFSAEQMPFAISRAINLSVQDAQKAERSHMQEAFTLRRKSWAMQSVKIKPFATKTNLSATIQIETPGNPSRSDILAQHEDGGEKTPQGQFIAIPNSEVINEAKVIPTAQRPRNLKDSFVLTGKDGVKRIFFRKGRGKKAQILPAYRLIKKVTLKPKLEFESTVTNTVDKNWNDNFNKAWQYAMDTALK
jgi:hypothetical protein